MGQHLTLKEAAEALGVSVDTVRRRIKSGQIPAEKVEGPHGLQWIIRANDLTASAEIIEVVPVKTELQGTELVALIREAVKEGQREQAEEVRQLRKEVTQLNERIEGLVRALPAGDPERKEKPGRWWSRLFKGGQE